MVLTGTAYSDAEVKSLLQALGYSVCWSADAPTRERMNWLEILGLVYLVLLVVGAGCFIYAYWWLHTWTSRD